MQEASMPVVSRPVPIGDKLYLDGGIADAVPYQYMEDLGYTRNVIILTQPRGYRKKKTSMFLIKPFLRKYPKLLETLENRPDMYNRQMEELDRKEAAKEALVLRPPEPLNIGHRETNPAELERVYQIGRKEAESRLEEIKSWLTGN